MIRAAARTVALSALLCAAACGAEDADTGERGAAPQETDTTAPERAERFRFVDVAAEAGLDAISWCGRPEKPHLLESGGAGIALVDFDGDGDLDAYVVTGWRLDGATIAEKPPNRLYRNRGDGTFDDVTESAGVGDTGWGQGIAAGDFDGDGHVDLFVTNFGPDVLYRNRGDGTFERVAGGPSIDGWSAAACFFDADGDGDEDLFVCGYVASTLDEVLHAQPDLEWKERDVMLGPFGLEGLANAYFRNDGGAFVRATEEAGLGDVGEFFSFAVAAADLDLDLDVDLYVANDSNPNYVYRNDGTGRFEEVGLWCGAGLSGPGAAQAGMSVGVGDPDLDLLPDVLVSNFADDVCTLYQNRGRGLFRDATIPFGLRDPTFAPLSWGVAFADLDLDGDEDLFIANGHIYPQADEPGTGTSFRQRNLLLENTGGRFRDVSAQAGPGLAVLEASHGVAAGDVDGDGDVDLLISNVDAPPTLLRNDSPRQGGWITVDWPGAERVVVETALGRQARFRVRGGSFCSVSDRRFHFGLGTATAATVTVTHPDGTEEVVRDVAPGTVVYRLP